MVSTGSKTDEPASLKLEGFLADLWQDIGKTPVKDFFWQFHSHGLLRTDISHPQRPFYGRMGNNGIDGMKRPGASLLVGRDEV